MSERRLKIVGEGPEWDKIQRIVASHPNIELLGYQSPARLAELMGAARAFVFAAEEDFGIAPVEAQACGTPVIAYARGGALETVRAGDVPNPTGVYFDSQTVPAVIEAVERFERERSGILAEDCRRNAERFSAARFREEFAALVEREWAAFVETRN